MEQLSGLAQVSQGTRRQCAQAASIICLMEVGCPPPKFLWSPKLLTSVGRSGEQDLREGPPVLGSTWSEFVFLAQ